MHDMNYFCARYTNILMKLPLCREIRQDCPCQPLAPGEPGAPGDGDEDCKALDTAG